MLTSQHGPDEKRMKSGWKYGEKMDVGGKKELGEEEGEEGIYMSKVGVHLGGPSILGKVVCLGKGKYYPL